MVLLKDLELELFESVSLKDLDKVALLNRIDNKYVFNASLLGNILKDLVNDYYILEIDGRRNFAYFTTYYDTVSLEMFINHVRGKLNRFKVRHRIYVDSGLSFLEIKFKNNKNRTIKWRTKEAFEDQENSKLNNEFLKKHVPYSAEELTPSLQNKFNRITLVDKDFTQRVTFDFKLGFNGNGDIEKEVHEIAIAELKIDKDNKNNKLLEVLRKYKIPLSGFSKYCIGKTISDDSLCHKKSNLKPKILGLNKIANKTITK